MQDLVLKYQYKPHGAMGPAERAPLVRAYLVMPGAKTEPELHQHRLVPGADPESYAPVKVAFPVSTDHPWSHDAAVRVLLMTQLQSSEGQWTYAKTASTEIYLADLLGTPGPHRLPMRLQSYYMPVQGHDSPSEVEAERHKGDLEVALVQAPAPRWATASDLDLVPRNIPALQSAMVMAVSRNMSPYNPRVALRPTMHETHNVHAPLYVQETQVALDGATFWTMTPMVARSHVHYYHSGDREQAEHYLDTLLRQSLARHDMPHARFITAGSHFQHGTAGPHSDLDLAVAVVATACDMRVNMMRYVADMARLPKSGREIVVESFDQVDLRTGDTTDLGGVRSLDLAPNLAQVVGAPADHTDDGSPVAVGGAMDCEDGGRDAAVHFALFSDPGAGLPYPKSKLVQAARAVASHYRGVGVLCSVLSRNLSDARGTSGDAAPAIGSPADRDVEVGAHMFLLLVPTSTIHENVARALASRSGARIDLGSAPPPPPQDYRPPVALCEGTGILHPLMVAPEFYARDFRSKLRAAVSSVMKQEGQVRMRTGHSSTEMQDMLARAVTKARFIQASSTPHSVVVDLSTGAPKAMDLFTPMHVQERTVDDPDQRVVPSFYRTAAELYLVPTRAELKARLRSESQPSSLPTLVGDRMIPMQIGDRTGRAGPSTWGVAVSDILRQRDFVGFMPMPQPTHMETQIVHRVHAHIAPAVPLHLHDEFVGSEWPALFRQMSGLEAGRHSPGRSVAVHGYAHPDDLDDDKVRAVAEWLGRNPHVIGASLTVERATYRLGTVRLDAVVDCGADFARRVADKIGPQLESSKQRSAQQLVPIGARLQDTTTPTFRAVMARHVELTIEYVEASWRNRNAGADLPADHAKVKALVTQFADWNELIRQHIIPTQMAVVTSLAIAAGRRPWRGIPPRPGRSGRRPRWAETGIGEFFEFPALVTSDHTHRVQNDGVDWFIADLLTRHTLYAKELADTSWGVTRLHDKSQALKKITGENATDIIAFWGAVFPEESFRRMSVDTPDQIAALWNRHLTCTLTYIETLDRVNDPDHPDFRKAATDCLRFGFQFGTLLDTVAIS